MRAAQLIELLFRHQVYNIKQAKRDIDAVYSMGLFDDVNILPSPSEDSNMENPKVRRRRSVPCVYDALQAVCRCTREPLLSAIARSQMVRHANDTLFGQPSAAQHGAQRRHSKAVSARDAQQAARM